jgi:hypothetical protein
MPGIKEAMNACAAPPMITYTVAIEIVASLLLYALTMASALAFVLHADKICNAGNI